MGLIMVALIMIGLVMRSTFTTIPLMLNDLSQALKLPIKTLGILTTIPLAMFMLISNFASKTIEWLGLKSATLLILGLLALGAGLRIITTIPTMLIGTALIGIAIAHLNVFMPTLVAEYFPQRIGVMTSLYSLAIMAGTIIFNLTTASIIALTSWHVVIWLLFLIPLAVLILWFFAMQTLPTRPRPTAKDWKQVKFKTWRNRRAWPFLIAFGSQSMLNYVFIAWLPVLMAYHHLNSQQIALGMTMMVITNIPIALLIPNLVTVLRSKQLLILVAAITAIGLIAAIMMFFQNDQFSFWLVEALLVGIFIGFFFIFTLTMFAVKTQTANQTAALSGMAQAGGYLLAALGPTAYGIAYGIDPLGYVQNIVFIATILLASAATFLIIKIKHV
ncbi:MFS transporter [Weissella oryzae]|nr:MFS transporter [Weissella oryzae]